MTISLFSKVHSPLRIHCWGGFGSQLNALCLALELNKLSPNRRLHLVFHTGGITKRHLEIRDLIPESISWDIIDDFVNEMNPRKSSRKSRIILSRFLASIRVIVSPNNNKDLQKIKPWTLSTRGHYSHINFSESVYSIIAKGLGLWEPRTDVAPLVLHYRLGDLIGLEKGFIKSTEICNVAQLFNPGAWLVLTDSPNDARNMLSNSDLNVKFNQFLSLTPKEILQIGFSSEVFIGTTSKLSIWVAIFRMLENRSATFLPREMQRGLSGIFLTDKARLVSYYP